MKNMLNKLKKAVIRLKHRTMIRSRIKLYFQNKRINKDLREMNLAWKNIYDGKRCFMIGTGPSLKDQDLTLLKDEYTFVANGFYLHPDYDVIHPKFFASIDPIGFDEDRETRKFLETISEKIHSDTVAIFPYQAKEKIERRGLFSKNKIIYLSQDKLFRDDLNFNLDIDKQIPVLPNSVHAPMVVANYLGFKTMYLLGMEHDWLTRRSSTPEVPYLLDSHFYEEDEFPVMPLFRIITPYEKQCENARMAFQAHRVLKEKMTDVKIYNLTPGSYLDVFPFKKYEDVIKEKK